MINWIEKAQWLCLPPHCIRCQGACDRALDLCQACEKELPWLQVACPRCALEIPLQAQQCGQCITSPPAFTQTCSCFIYESPLTNYIHQLKFQHRLLYAHIMGTLLSQQLIRHYNKFPQAILPIPLHIKRLNQRGYNQALEIAKPIAKALNLPILHKHSQRTRHTNAQAQTEASKRAGNIQGAFRLTQSIPYSYVAIVDDVMTTGNTAHEFSKLLLANGVEQVDVWCVARTQVHSII